MKRKLFAGIASIILFCFVLYIWATVAGMDSQPKTPFEGVSVSITEVYPPGEYTDSTTPSISFSGGEGQWGLADTGIGGYQSNDSLSFVVGGNEILRVSDNETTVTFYGPDGPEVYGFIWNGQLKLKEDL
jgi:hypothetical protein